MARILHCLVAISFFSIHAASQPLIEGLVYDFNGHVERGANVLEINGRYYWGTYGGVNGSRHHNILKIDKDGNVIQEFYNDSQYVKTQILAASGDTGLVSLNKAYWNQSHPINHGTSDLVVTNYDTIGNTVWESTITDSGYSEEPLGIFSVDDGYLVFGRREVSLASSGTDQSTVVVHLNSQGEVSSTNIYEFLGSAVTMATNGDALIAGTDFIARLNSSGSLIGIDTLNNSSVAFEVLQQPDGDIFLVNNESIRKIDGSGNNQWNLTITNGEFNSPRTKSAVVLQDGSIVCVGHLTLYQGTDKEPAPAKTFGWIIKVGASGQLI